MKYLLLALLAVTSSCATCPPQSTSWAGFHGPAYLPATPARRPPQHVLDSLARAASRPNAHLLAK